MFYSEAEGGASLQRLPGVPRQLSQGRVLEHPLRRHSYLLWVTVDTGYIQELVTVEDQHSGQIFVSEKDILLMLLLTCAANML